MGGKNWDICKLKNLLKRSLDVNLEQMTKLMADYLSSLSLFNSHLIHSKLFIGGVSI